MENAAKQGTVSNSHLIEPLGVEPVTAYQCKCCKTLYETEQAANICAGKHRTNLRIAAAQYDRERKLPCTVTIEFTEGLTTYQHDYHYD